MPSSKTLKKRYNSSHKKHKNDDIIVHLLELLMSIKFYHWRTHSYSQHKATDELYEELNENIDDLAEALMGATETRIPATLNLTLTNCRNSDELSTYINKCVKMLAKYDFNNLAKHASATSDLMNIRDEILAALHKFLYLLSLNDAKF